MSDQSQTNSEEKADPALTQNEKPETPPKENESVSLLNEDQKPSSDPSKTKETTKDEKDDKSAGAPEKYEAFKLPEGFEASEELMGEAQTVFKELGLSQAHAQRLVDFYAKASADAAEAPVKFWLDQQKAWRDEIKADPEIGGKLGAVRQTIGKMYDALGPANADLVSDFREAMDLTGAGNNPAFVKFMFKIAERLTEGTHVEGDKGKPKPGSAAQAMYPDLPSAG